MRKRPARMHGVIGGFRFSEIAGKQRSEVDERWHPDLGYLEPLIEAQSYEPSCQSSIIDSHDNFMDRFWAISRKMRRRFAI